MFADNGQVMEVIKLPFRALTFRHVQVQPLDTNGDGVTDAILVTALRGKKHVSRVIPV